MYVKHYILKNKMPLLNQFLKQHFSLDDISTNKSFDDDISTNKIISLAKWLENQYGVPSCATLDKWKDLTSLNTQREFEPTLSEFEPTSSTSSETVHVQLKEFKPLKLIGTGHHGKVFLVERNDKLFALKVVEKVDRKCFGEFAALKRLGVSNLTSRLHFCFETSKAMYFAMDFAQGGDLFTYNHRNCLTETNIRLIASSVVQALEYIHAKGMIYRDLKLENVLLTKTGHVILSDFGLCAFDDVSTGFCGTRPYIAPEVYKREKYTNKVDSYSLGVMLVELMGGNIQDSSADEEYAPPTIPNYRQQRFSNALVDLVSKLIEQNPYYRLSIAQIKNHPFFRKIEWNLVEQCQYDGLEIEYTSEKDVSNFDSEFTNVSINEFKHLLVVTNNKKVKSLFP